MKKKGRIIAFLIICSILLITMNIVGILDIITSTCAPWEKVIAIFAVFGCTNALGLHFLAFLHDLD